MRRTLAIVAVLYAIEGFPMGAWRDGILVYLRRHEAPLEMVGALSGLSLAWSAKVLWSPLVDRFGERRRWIQLCLAVMALALASVPALDPRSVGALAWAVLAALCVASATQDIAIDAYTIGLVPRGEEGPANAVRTVAYRVGFIASGSGLLVLAGLVGWPQSFTAGAVSCAAAALLVSRMPRIELAPGVRRDARTALGRLVSRPDPAGLLAFVLLFRIGDLALGPMTRTLWVDRGIGDAEIGFATGLGVGASILGAILGGWIVARRGIRFGLVTLGAFALVSNLGYAVASLASPVRPALYAASLLESLCSGLVAPAFVGYLMRLCDREHAGVQYALLSALYALPGTLFAAGSGWLTQWLGYAGFFTATAALALPGLALAPRAARRQDVE
jgi:PAT family beta-lactamase induction signal transducer AmpG